MISSVLSEGKSREGNVILTIVELSSGPSLPLTSQLFELLKVLKLSGSLSLFYKMRLLACVLIKLY